MSLSNTGRLIEIYKAFAKYRCYFFLKGTSYYRFAVIFGKIIAPKADKSAKLLTEGQKLSRIFQELGPAFIKLGQAMSVRPDIVGDRIATDLSNLQDRLPPFSSVKARHIIEEELGKKIAEVFSRFDDKPAAAASISQVHFATDINGNEVAVKILRPDIERLFFKDINLFYWLAGLANRKFPQYKRLKLLEIVDTMADITKIEMDLQFEAAAADELAENFQNDPELKVPKVYWQLTTSKVLTIEKIYGIRIDNPKKLVEAGHDLDDILRKSANIFLKQALRDGFFHADMHPGNLLVDKDGRICVFDFGIMGRIDTKNRIFLAEMLMGFLQRDYKKVSEIHFQAGYIPENQSPELFAQACRAIGEPILDLPQNQISIARLLQKLFRITEQFQMETQPQLLLLQKTMMMAEGIGRKLNAEVNFWILSRDLIEEWGRQNLGAKAKIKEEIRLTFDSIKSIGEASRNLNKIVTKQGLITYQPNIIIKKDNSLFWKGFFSAVFLLSLIVLIIIKPKL